MKVTGNLLHEAPTLAIADGRVYRIGADGSRELAENPPNPSGIRPTEFKVLILPKVVEEKTKGGILLPDEHKDRQQFAQQEGTIIAVAPLAFTYASKDEWERAGGQPPKVGDRVSYAKFAGAQMKGPKDGKDYRVVNDKDIYAVLD
jgi:chaperonin GroES